MKTPVKLLYIEDDELDRRAFLRMVREKDLPYDLRTAETLAEARAHLASSRFDIIVADYHLPDGHCTELFDEIPDTPFILLTGTLEEQLALRTLAARGRRLPAQGPPATASGGRAVAVEKTLYRHHLRGVEERLTRELREQDRRMRLAQQATGVGTFEWDIPHNRVTWSPELERLYGLPPGGFGGRYEVWIACVHPDDRPETERQHERALATGRMEADWRVVWPDGTVRWLAGRATVEMDAAGKPLRMLGVNIDITDRKRAEELSRDQAALLNLAHDAILVRGTEGKITFWNRGAQQTYGWTCEEALGQVAQVLLNTRFPKSLADLTAEVAKKGQWEGELAHTRKDGRQIVVASRWAVQRDQSDRQVGILEINRDITDRKRAGEALRRSEALYRTMARSIPEAVLSVVDWNLRYLTAEGELLPRIGLSREGMEGRTVQDVFEGESGRIRAEYFRRALAGESTSYETEYHNRTIWSQFVPLREEDGEVFAAMCLVLDITERKKAEAEIILLRDRLAADLAGMNRLHQLSTRFVSQDDLQTLLDAILDASLAITGAAKGHVQLLNIASGELGITAQRGFDQAFVEFFNHIRAGVVACGTAMKTRQCVVVEDVTLSSLFLVEPRALELVLAAGMRAVVCTPLLTRTSQMVGVLSILFPVPHRPSERDLRLLDLLARQAADFIERTRAEQALRAARQELARANEDLERKVQERTASLQQTIAELEHFSYTITHDMRAPLRAMRTFATMLQEECGDSLKPNPLDYLQRIATAADRMDHLILDALDYSKVIRQDLPITPVDPDALLRGMIESYPAFQPPQAEIKLAGKLPLVMANQAGLTQCFSNLLGNAVKFVEPGHVPQVLVRAEPREDYVRLWFEDKGIGISPEVHDRIFDMFQRVNKEYEGTGIGLALVRKNVHQMGGKVGVESEPGKGSRFWLELKQAT